MGAYYSSVNWFNRLMNTAVTRPNKIRRYDMMDNTVDVSRALDLLAEDISSDNADDDDTFNIEYDESSNPKKTLIKAIEATKKKWKRRTKFDHMFFDYVREMLKYGCVIFKVSADHTLTKLVQERIVGYVLDEADDETVTHYLYDPNSIYENKNGDRVGNHAGGHNAAEIQTIPVKDLLIMKRGEGPFGRSVLEDVYRVWRQMSLLEDSIVIYRIVRAPERRVFYIDTGRMPGKKAEAYMEQLKLKLRQRQISRNSSVETEYNPSSIQEDYFIAQKGDGRGSKVETLPGGQNLDQIKDLVWFTKKLAAGLRIPNSYMQSIYDENGGQGNQYNDGRLGTAYIEELRYAGHIMRIQKKVANALWGHFKDFAKRQGVTVDDTMNLRIAAPQNFAVYKENELFNTLLNTVQSADNIKYIDKSLILEKFLHFDKEDLLENENRILCRKGLDEAQIKAITDLQRMNIVYGDASKLKDFGIEPSEDDMGRF